jgi:hypothetical protein
LLRARQPWRELSAGLERARWRRIEPLAMLLLGLLASCSTHTALAPAPTSGPAAVEIDDVLPLRLPDPPQMPAGLPGVCVVGEGEDCSPLLTGDVVVPPLRWVELGLYLSRWAQYPGLVRGLVADRDGIWRLVASEALDAYAAEVMVAQVEAEAASASDWPEWQVWVAVVIGVVLGAAGGVVGGVLLAVSR